MSGWWQFLLGNLRAWNLDRRIDFSPWTVIRIMDVDHCDYISCLCGYRGRAVPMRQHMECPGCYRVVEACCEGVPEYR